MANVTPVDGWTAVHALSGAAAGLARIPAVPALALSIVYEFVEPPLEAAVRRAVEMSAAPESPVNRIMDVLASAVGYGFGAALAYGARRPAR